MKTTSQSMTLRRGCRLSPPGWRRNPHGALSLLRWLYWQLLGALNGSGSGFILYYFIPATLKLEIGSPSMTPMVSYSTLIRLYGLYHLCDLLLSYRTFAKTTINREESGIATDAPITPLPSLTVDTIYPWVRESFKLQESFNSLYPSFTPYLRYINILHFWDIEISHRGH